MNNHPEILAPVGSDEQLLAAVRSGANAVYLGTKSFNARRNADNFDSLNLKEAVKYCHSYNVKVYVTLNTIVFDYELKELYRTIKEIAESGADAVIVQDFATVKAVKKICPTLPLHASTQMAVHNVSGVKLLEKFGFSRVVLARELSFKEIEKIVKSTTLETEIFVHGAHCMSASGNCYISAFLGERSGNRGLCAQPCRLDWKIDNKNFALSLKDMSYIDHLKELESIGVTSFKIEGRMKRPEYVASSVNACKNALNNKNYNKELLKAVFSRNGFTDGYLMDKRNSDMFGYRSKDDVISATNDVFKELQALYKNDTPVTPVNMTFTVTKESTVLEMTANGVTVSATTDGGEIPIKSALSFEMAEKNLKKLGGTPYFLNDLKFNNPANLTLSLSTINALRRECVEKLGNKLNSTKRESFDVVPESKENNKKRVPTLRTRFSEFRQYSGEFDYCEYLIFPIKEVLSHAEELEKIKGKIVIELPDLIYPFYEDELLKELQELNSLGFKNAISGNIGGIEIIKNAGLDVFGGHTLNIANSEAVEFYEAQGVKDLTLSVELSAKSIDNINSNVKIGAYCYGNLPLMFFRNCPLKQKDGCGNCNGRRKLTDRKNIEFLVFCHDKMYSVLHNSVPLYICDKINLNCDFLTMYFSDESKEECKEILSLCKSKQSAPFKKTAGLYLREVL
ncbi:MAG: U32 family peptidase [Ruminococcaceae bacterium]|nr:U32 family peptidase [Oscillospiraceae bacterium]